MGKMRTSQSFDKHIYTLVSILVSTGSEKINCVVEIKVELTVKMSTNKLVNALLVASVQVLKFMHS